MEDVLLDAGRASFLTRRKLQGGSGEKENAADRNLRARESREGETKNGQNIGRLIGGTESC